MRSTKASNDPDELTASTIAASFALSTISARHRSRTDIDSPALMPIQLGSHLYASAVATAFESRVYLPALTSSSTRNSVISFVTLAGYASASALSEKRTRPLFASAHSAPTYGERRWAVCTEPAAGAARRGAGRFCGAADAAAARKTAANAAVMRNVFT